MWRVKCSLVLLALCAIAFPVYANSEQVSCSVGLGYGYVEISTSAIRPTSFERTLAQNQDVSSTRYVHNTSSAHEMSFDCLLSEHVGVRGSYIDGLQFSVVNTVTSPQLFINTPFNQISFQPFRVKMVRKIEGTASGLFVYYREPITSQISVSFEGGFYHIRAKGHWEAGLEDIEGKRYLTLLGETEHQEEYFPSFVLSGNVHLSKRIELVGRYLPVPGKDTKLLFLTLNFAI